MKQFYNKFIYNLNKSRIIFLLLILIFLTSLTFSQNLEVNKIEPPNWWVGMKWDTVQLMVYGKNLNDISARFANNKIKVLKVHNAHSKDYSFIDVKIPADLKGGNYKLILSKGNYKTSVDYPIYDRKTSKGKYKGFSPKDVIYLITPDRFADGDTTNNVVKGMLNEYNIKNPNGRHGGDIQGIINHLNYIKNLGFTAIWINPLVENNTHISYHGYSVTNMYKIDPRFGTNKLYKKLVADAHKDGLKVILDHVSNHISIDHPWIKDLPFPDWIHGTVKKHSMTHHDKLAFADIHRDSATIKNTTTGWFTNQMPDLNQADPYLANYIIQNTIWWIESTGLDGIREDTYPYCYQKFMAKWAKAILNEYPHFNILGEIWTGDAVFLSSFQRHSYYPKEFETNLPCLTDYATHDAFAAYLKGEKGIHSIYEDFAKDFIYPDPQNLVTFLDNHDVERALYLADGNINKVKTALLMLLTSRGIPQIYYGTEIGILGGNEHGYIRADFPGGFPGDKHNAFSQKGRTSKENNMYNYLYTLLHLRNKHRALSTGKLIQYPPRNEIFVYFKDSSNEKIMVMVNNNSKDESVSVTRFADQLDNVKEIKDLVTNKTIPINKNSNLKLEELSGRIFQLIY